MKNSKKMRINKIISKQKSKKSKNNLRKKHITNKNNYRNKKRINKSIKYGGMEATNTTSNSEIPIIVKMNDEIRSIKVNKGDNIYNSIKQALIDKFPAHIPLRISFGGDVDDHPDNTFEVLGIEANSTILVDADLYSFCRSRWKNIDIPIQQYIEGLDNFDRFFTKQHILTQLEEALIIPDPPIPENQLNQKILELIQRLTKGTDPNTTLCETQIKLLDHNIILPGDEQIQLQKDFEGLAEDPRMQTQFDSDEDETFIYNVLLPLLHRIRELDRLDLKNRPLGPNKWDD